MRLRLFFPLCSLLVLMAAPAPLVHASSSPDSLTIVAFGDSLTAGYGLSERESFPSRLEALLRERGEAVRVINAGVSGDTTAGGLARIDWVLASEPDLVIVELGANDALRGLEPSQAEANLDAILARIEESGARALLAGMRAPRNLGEEYVRRFDAIYPALAARHNVPLYPFFLEGVAGRPDLNLGDGIHPNAQGVEEIARRLLPQVHDTLQEIRSDRKRSGG